MTPERRAEILSKEVLCITDIMELCGVGKTVAGNIFRRIKKSNDRLGIDTVVHIQDYIDTFGLDVNRFLMPKKERPYEYEVVKQQ